MKRFMKILSVGISALIGMSTLSVTASAETNLSAEYLLNDENVVWTSKDSYVGNYYDNTRCYDDGTIISSSGQKYKLFVVYSSGESPEGNETMFSKLPDKVTFDDRLCFTDIPENAWAIEAESMEELETLKAQAESNYNSGEIDYFKAAEYMYYQCVTDAGIEITLKEADPTYNPQEYEGLENVSYKADENYKVYTISAGADKTKLKKIMLQIALDERIEYRKNLFIMCCTAHYAVNEILTLRRTETGDVTDDMNVDIYDAIEIAKYVMNMVEFDEDTLAIADYNADGDVNLYDVIDIAKTLM